MMLKTLKVYIIGHATVRYIIKENILTQVHYKQCIAILMVEKNKSINNQRKEFIFLIQTTKNNTCLKNKNML